MIGKINFKYEVSEILSFSKEFYCFHSQIKKIVVNYFGGFISKLLEIFFLAM